MIKINQEKLAQIEQDRINAKARAYLASTDWYVARFAETGVAIPAEVVAARQEAREFIVEVAV